MPPEELGSYLRDIYQLLESYGYTTPMYGHFGQGCVHLRITFDLETAAGIAKYREFIEQAADIVLAHGGSLSGEHGDGQARGALLPKMYGPELMKAFQEFKALWDPDNGMNPGKMIDPVAVYEPVDNLRLGVGYQAKKVDTWFQYPGPGRIWRNHAALRGCGRLPQTGPRHHVPQLYGHAGGKALHPRTSPPAVGDVARPGDHRRMAQCRR